MSIAERLPTGRPGQAIAVGLSLVALLLIWEAAVAPLVDLFEARAADVAEAQARASHMEALAEALPALRTEARRASRSGPSASSLLTGSSDAVAAATLQGRVQDMATNAGTTLSSTEALAARQQGAYRRIALRISLNATLPVLVRLLQSLDESTPRMLVDDLQLHTSPIIIAQTRTTSPPLDASLTVIAYRLGRADDEGDADGDAP